MKYRNRKRNKNIIITLILISLLIIGYSLISTNFNIGGVFTLEPVVSNVHYDEDISYDDDNTVDGVVTIDDNKTTASTTVSFNNPDDKYSFVIPIVNEGTVDSMLDTITVSGLTTTQQQYIKVSYEYEDGIEPTQYDLLKAGETEYLKVNIVYNIDEINDKDDLPEEGDHIELRINVQYLQADENVHERVYDTFYGRNETKINLNEEIPSSISLYSNYRKISLDSINFFIKYKTNQNLVQDMYIGFLYNNNLYYLKGTIDENEEEKRIVYDNNKYILTNVFDSKNCEDSLNGDLREYECSNSDITISVFTNGMINIKNKGYGCSIGLNVSTYYGYCYPIMT
ncbi:MAG: hypothetical protein IKH54_01150 [Bacilli bacterium]|nr:hypothetical protein [Bacilli bacterium]